MLLGVLGCIDFTMNLSKSLMWHIFIGWCKPKGLYSVLIEFNFIYIYIYMNAFRSIYLVMWCQCLSFF